MKFKIKRILAVMLVFCMMMVMMPMQAFAEEQTYVLSVSAEPAEGGTVYIDTPGVTEVNADVEAAHNLYVKVNEGYKFTGWYKNDSYVGGNANFAFPVYTHADNPSSDNYVAKFAKNINNIEITMPGKAGDTLSRTTVSVPDGAGYQIQSFDKLYVYESADSENYTFIGEDTQCVLAEGNVVRGNILMANPLSGYAYDSISKITATVNGKSATVGDMYSKPYITFEYTVSASAPTTHTVTFDSDGGSVVEAQTINEGNKATKPADPTKDGFTFKGWYLGETEYDFTTPVTEPITLKAKWDAATPTPEIWVGGVGMVSGDYLAQGASATTTTKPDDNYAYYKDGVLTLHNYSYSGAGYSGFAVYCPIALTMELEGENSLTGKGNEAIAVVGGLIIGGNGKLALSSDYEYCVYSTALTFQDSCTVTADTGIYASGVLSVKETAAVILNGSGELSASQIDISGGTVTVTAIDNYGIYAGKDISISGGTITVTARKGDTYSGVGIYSHTGNIEISGGTVTVNADGNGIYAYRNLTISGGTVTVTAGVWGIKAQHKDLTVSGGNIDVKSTATGDDDNRYYALSYSTGEGSLTFDKNLAVLASTEPDGTFVPYVKADNNTYDHVKIGTEPAPTTYTVTFDSDGGSAVAAQTINEGNKVTKPADPTKEGYIFKGWFNGENEYDFDTAVTAPITLKAKWEAEPEVTKYDVWVAGTQVTSANKDDILGDGAASYNPTTNTLTVSKNITATGDDVSAIKATTEDDFTVDIDGSVAISSEDGNGIEVENKAIVTGGSLTITADSYGIYAEEIAVGGGTYIVSGWRGLLGKSGVAISNATVTITAKNNAIYSFNDKCYISISNSTVTATSTENRSIFIEEDGEETITISDSTVTVTGSNCAVYAPKVEVTGNSVVEMKATITDTPDDDYCALSGCGDNFIVAETLEVLASTEVDGSNPVPYVKADRVKYDWVKIAAPAPTTYTVTFDSDGGSAVTAQNVESGQTATEPTAPTKEGYTFKGWTYKGSPYNFSKPVAENITLYARWGTEYNITAIPTPISGQSISSDDLDSYFPSSSSYAYKNSTPYWDWYDPGVPSGVAVAGTNYYAYAIMYLEDYSAVPYEGDFVVKYAGTELSKISSTDIYKDNMKSGYRIYMYDTYNVALQVRVYLGTPTGAGNTYNIISGANGIYQKGSTADKLSFTADGNIADFIGVEVDGYLINVSDYNVESGPTIVELKKAYLESLSAGEHTLKIRYHDGEASTKFTVKDVVPTSYTVTVENGTGDGDYASGATVTVTADTIPGKLFREWTTSDGVTFADSKSATTSFTMPDKDVTVTAVYNTIITVIDISGITTPVAGAVPSDSFAISTTGVEVGSNTFWQVYDEATNTLKASYADSKIVNSEPFRAGTYVKLQAEVIAKEGYVFTPDTVIRYNGVELPVKDDSNLKQNFCYPVVAEHRNRTAASIGWEVKNNAYTVTFDSDSGSAVAPQTVEEGKTATKPSDPTREGFTFKGWFLGETAYDFATPVTGDITLKAKWEAAAPIKYAIEVTLNGYSLGGKVAYASVSESSDTVNIVTFADEKNFYIMTDDGGEPDWSSDVTEFAAGTDYWLVVGIEKENGEYLNLTDIDEEDVTLAGGCVSKIFIEDDALLACFKLKPLEAPVPTTYTVTFDSDGGSAVADQTVESGKTATKPANPTKSGYTFQGWTLDGKAYDFTKPVAGNITLKATWKANTSTPPTGDNALLGIWACLILASLCGMGAVVVCSKKKYVR